MSLKSELLAFMTTLTMLTLLPPERQRDWSQVRKGAETGGLAGCEAGRCLSALRNVEEGVMAAAASVITLVLLPEFIWIYLFVCFCASR